MDWGATLDTVVEFLQKFQTEKVLAYLKEADMQSLMQHPYFLGAVGTLAVIALIMKWRLLLVTLMSITGFAYLLSYTLAQDTSLEGGIGNDALVVFIGGGTVIVFLAIYLLFIRGE